MLNFLNTLRKCSHTKELAIMKTRNITRSVHHYNFDTNEEIIDNYLGNVMMIGINIPDNRNVLTETAVEKLYESIKLFEKNDEISVAILHGLGGNFCTGLESTEKALKKSRDLMKALNTLQKPLIGSLNGYTTNFGFHLATMCDILVMEENALAGFGQKQHRSELFDFMLLRLVANVGFSRTMELISVWGTWPAQKCFDSNFVNIIVSCGCGLGHSIQWAQNIAKDSVDVIRTEKLKVLSVLNSLPVK